MKALKTRDLREKTISELEEMVEKERAALYDLRRRLALRETQDTSAVKATRHNIARILTVLTEKKREEAKQ
ncbi:MAG: 50S ribosomal protein L29 [Armatimonadota bacterium]